MNYGRLKYGNRPGDPPSRAQVRSEEPDSAARAELQAKEFIAADPARPFHWPYR